MIEAVLDASAMLAMLLVEPGGDLVEQILSDCAISTVNLSEVISHYTRSGVAIEAVRSIIDPLPVDRMNFDEELAFTVARLLPVTKALGLSFGDRACLALAIKLGVPAMTTDKSWARLPIIEGLTVKVIR